jgi:hypothetical protein
MMKNRIKQSCIAFSIVTVLLAGCSATGETYTDKFAEGEHQEDTTIVDHAVALAVEKLSEVTCLESSSQMRLKNLAAIYQNY